MTTTLTLSAALEAYLGLGSRKLPWPGTEYERLVELVGKDANALQEKLEAVLSSVEDSNAFLIAGSLSAIANLAANRAKQQHPEFSDALCMEIGRYISYGWK